MDHIENKLSDYTLAHNEVVDTHDGLAEEICNMRIKMADIEDRSCRNNVKFRGILKTFSLAELHPYLQKTIAELLPETNTQKLVIDMAHRLPKPSYLPERVPRDVIARIHDFHIKDQLMYFTCKRNSLPEPYSEILRYIDLSKATIQAHKNLITITKILRNNNILYK